VWNENYEGTGNYITDIFVAASWLWSGHEICQGSGGNTYFTGVQGKGLFQQGDKIAARYITDEFERLGLLPLNGESYLQKFPISVNTFPVMFI
jgi:hypothetical protein